MKPKWFTDLQSKRSKMVSNEPSGGFRLQSINDMLKRAESKFKTTRRSEDYEQGNASTDVTG